MTLSMLLIILAIIVFMIIPSFKDRVIPVKKLILMPVVFSYLLYQTITDTFSLNFTNQWIIALGIIVGVGIGVLMRWKVNIKADQNQRLILLPGSHTNLVIFVLIFTVHFAIGYIKSVSPAYFTHTTAGEQLLLFALATVSSITIGTGACLYYKYTVCASTQLEFVGRRKLF